MTDRKVKGLRAESVFLLRVWISRVLSVDIPTNLAVTLTKWSFGVLKWEVMKGEIA